MVNLLVVEHNVRPPDVIGRHVKLLDAAVLLGVPDQLVVVPELQEKRPNSVNQSFTSAAGPKMSDSSLINNFVPAGPQNLLLIEILIIKCGFEEMEQRLLLKDDSPFPSAWLYRAF